MPRFRRSPSAPAATSVANLLFCSSLLLAGSCRERGEPSASAPGEPPAEGERSAPMREAFGCARAISQARSVLTVELAGVPGATVPLERALAVAAASCRDDAWPEPLRRCLIEVPLVGDNGGGEGLWSCAAHVPEALRPRLERALRAAVAP